MFARVKKSGRYEYLQIVENSKVSSKVLSRAGRYHEVHPEEANSKAPAPLEVKEVMVEERRYIVCRNARQARKDAAARQAIVEALEERLKSNPKGLVGNRGYARYLKAYKGAMVINQEKIEEGSPFRWQMGAAYEHEPR